MLFLHHFFPHLLVECSVGLLLWHSCCFFYCAPWKLPSDWWFGVVASLFRSPSRSRKPLSEWWCRGFNWCLYLRWIIFYLTFKVEYFCWSLRTNWRVEDERQQFKVLFKRYIDYCQLNEMKSIWYTQVYIYSVNNTSNYKRKTAFTFPVLPFACLLVHSPRPLLHIHFLIHVFILLLQYL